jgi:hypothetical protein
MMIRVIINMEENLDNPTYLESLNQEEFIDWIGEKNTYFKFD